MTCRADLCWHVHGFTWNGFARAQARCEHPTISVQGATLMPGRAKAQGTHNDIEPGVEADHLPCKERQHRG